MYPNNSAISAVIGEDMIHNDKTYAGYFEGRGYFSDNLGIGTAKPSAKLEIADGDIFISDIDKGIIMKSPDGNCWRGVLDNSGNLTFSSISCPNEESVPTVIKESIKNELNVSISIFPNPSKREITIDVDQFNTETLKYFIHTMDGKLIQTDFFVNTSSEINISSLKSGVYLVTVNDEFNNKIGSERLVVL